ncbi:exosortase H [Comamonas flocculans]|uniref:Exosortase H n=1 Tax=Comamonas flocculans TaxID=2597701 RepID=A0A5B8RT17_9BURK|nr:exosortase H [Comamonas flocculans]QEA12620.1 exosortase H [Comamonas flocculans]
MLRFFLLFLGIQLSLFGVNMLNWVQQHAVLPWTALLARISAGLVTWFDASAAAQGKVLWNTATGFGVSIEPGCNGIEACIVLAAAILAFPAPWRSKLRGLLIGSVAVQALNVVRVISLFYIGQWNTAAFNFAHEFLWQALIMLDVLVVWLLWVRTTTRAGAQEGDGPPPNEPPNEPPAAPPSPPRPAAPRGQGVVSHSPDLSLPHARA